MYGDLAIRFLFYFFKTNLIEPSLIKINVHFYQCGYFSCPLLDGILFCRRTQYDTLASKVTAIFYDLSKIDQISTEYKKWAVTFETDVVLISLTGILLKMGANGPEGLTPINFKTM